MMDIKNYLQDFTKMVDVLKAHPKVRLLSFHAFEPASEADILDVEEHLGFALDEDLKTFYRQCNGLQLRWAHEENPDWDRDELSGFVPGPFSYQDVIDDDGTIDGCVNILPIKEVFLTDWEERFGLRESHPESLTIGSETLKYSDFANQTKVFNLFLYSSSFGILNLVGNERQTVIRGISKHQFYYFSRRSSIFYHLSALIQNYGSISRTGTSYSNKHGLSMEVLNGVAPNDYGNLDFSVFAD